MWGPNRRNGSYRIPRYISSYANPSFIKQFDSNHQLNMKLFYKSIITKKDYCVKIVENILVTTVLIQYFNSRLKELSSNYDMFGNVKKFGRFDEKDVTIHPIWGRHLAEHRLNTDQVGINLDVGSNKTFNTKGENTVWIAGVSGGDKRFCTIQITARPVNHPLIQPRLTMIFEGQDLRISELEKQQWDNRINVKFQASACADSAFCLQFAAEEGKAIFLNL